MPAPGDVQICTPHYAEPSCLIKFSGSQDEHGLVSKDSIGPCCCSNQGQALALGHTCPLRCPDLCSIGCWSHARPLQIWPCPLEHAPCLLQPARAPALCPAALAAPAPEKGRRPVSLSLTHSMTSSEPVWRHMMTICLMLSYPCHASQALTRFKFCADLFAAIQAQSPISYVEQAAPEQGRQRMTISSASTLLMCQDHLEAPGNGKVPTSWHGYPYSV